MPAHFSSLADICIVVIIIFLVVPAGYRNAVVTRASSSHVNIFSGLSETRGPVWIVAPDACIFVRSLGPLRLAGSPTSMTANMTQISD